MAKADGSASNGESGRRITADAPRDDSDLPPDAIVIPITQETSWQDLNTAYDSEDSTRGCTNPKSQSNPFTWSKHGCASRVAATNLNATTSAPIIGLPAKIQRPGFIICHRPPSIFPKGRSSGSKKTGLADTEPGSPKVSCLGHVLSERERERRRKQRETRREGENEDESVACCAGFSLILQCGGNRKRGESSAQAAEVRQSPPGRAQPSTEARRSEGVQQPEEEGTKPLPEVEARPSPEKVEMEVEPPAIAAMIKFSSGRRAASWGDDVVAEKEGRRI